LFYIVAAAGKSPASMRFAPYPGKWSAGLLPDAIREYTKKGRQGFPADR